MLACQRFKVSDSQLVDKAEHPKFIWSQRWTSMKIVEIDQWYSPEVKTITITQDVGRATYDLQVREFVPVKGDALVRAWKTNGVEKYHDCAPYAIMNMAQTGDEIARFVDNNIENFIQYYIRGDDELLWGTYSMAYQYSKAAEVSRPIYNH